MKTLEHLKAWMETVRAQVNSFEARFYFGGMVAITALLAIIALSNTDLLVDQPVVGLPGGWASPFTWIVVALLLAAVWELGTYHFRTVANRIVWVEEAYWKNQIQIQGPSIWPHAQ